MLYNPKWKENKFGFDKHGYPRCPSALIRHGLECLEKRIAKEPNFTPDWYNKGKCLAGCAIWQGGVSRHWWAGEKGCLTALSRFSRGGISRGFESLGIEKPPNLPDSNDWLDGLPGEEIMANVPAFLKQMNNMADMLEAEGF